MKKRQNAHLENGQALVELAVSLPVLLLLLFGIMEFGWYFYNQMSIENGSREGARYAIVNSESATLTTDVEILVQNMIKGPGATVVLVSLIGDDIKVTVNKSVPTLTPIASLFTNAQGGMYSLSAFTQMKIA